MDWYQAFTGRPHPGRQRREEFRRYARSGDAEVERQSGAVEAGRAGDTYLPPSWAQTGPTRGGAVPLSALTGVARAPYEPASERPFGDDFASWYEATRYGRPLPAGMQADSVPAETVATNVGREPTNRNNVIADATETLTDEYLATREEPFAEAHYRSRPQANGSHIRTSRPVFDPVQEAPPEAFRPHDPTTNFDPTRAWIEAEERAAVRWQAGKPNPVDQFIRIVFGDEDARVVKGFIDRVAEDIGLNPNERIERETQQMRDRVRDGR